MGGSRSGGRAALFKARAARPPPIPLEVMLRGYFIEQRYALSDAAMEDAVYVIQLMRRFADLELIEDALPDEAKIFNSCRLLERHELISEMINVIHDVLAAKGTAFKGGAMMDATIIHAAPSAKNATGKRDPEMRQAKKAVSGTSA